MKKTLVISLCLLLVASFALAKNVVKKEPVRVDRADVTNPLADTKMVPERAAAADTFWLGVFTFDSGPNCVTEGYTTEDITAQMDSYWHVDNLAAMVPEGSNSMWCGARPDASSLILCGYANLPGYGNGWNQALCYDDGVSTCLTVTTGVSINFSTRYDSEAEYDATTLEVDNCDENWVDLYGGVNVWDGEGSDTLQIAVSDTLHSGSLGIRFHFEADGAYSDQDFGDFTGVAIDELSVTDDGGTVVPYEDFEGYTPAKGTTSTTYWKNCTPPGYGDFASLYPGITVVQEDLCTYNYTCLWGFFNGSTYNYGCGGWPAQAAVPYENVRGQYIWNEAWTPFMPVAGSGSLWQTWFDVYGDVPLHALIFYIWHVRSVIDGCPQAWRDYNYVYYAGNPSWGTEYRTKFGQFLAPGVEEIQFAHGVIDMCPYWKEGPDDCLCHSHGPIQDYCRVFRVDAGGPQWSASRDLDEWQDTFATDGSLTGTARIDAATDIEAYTDPIAVAGDSTVVIVGDPENGLDNHVHGDVTSGPAVYAFVSVDGPSSGITGDQLVQVPSSEYHGNNDYNYIGTAGPWNGRMWYQVQMDTSFNDPGARLEPAPDEFCIDLNDNLFVPGDTVWFFMGAKSTTGVWTYGRGSVAGYVQWTDPNEAAVNADEVTILPAGGYNRGGDILYVDGMHTRGAQPYFDTAFEQMGILDLVDRYDIRAPSSQQSNHPGNRCVSVVDQLIPAYRKIIWNTGNLIASYADGTVNTDKSDDTGLTYTFLQNLPEGVGGGIYLSGDDVAEEWVNTFVSGSATDLKSAYMTFNVTSGDHVPTVGVAPYGVGVVGNKDIFYDSVFPDSLVAYGGCPGINDFDILVAEGDATVEMNYHGKGTTAGAIVAKATVNPLNNTVGFVLSGFSFHYIRDAGAGGVPARSEHMFRILTWLQNPVTYPVGAGTPSVAVNELEQNYPNPFNPTTTIKYQIKETGYVSLRVYNVAGQLVRTLVDEQVKAGVVNNVQWHGLNDAGQQVSSGVYFYKLVTTNFTQTKKMVLLK
jgi:hypothetical protein